MTPTDIQELHDKALAIVDAMIQVHLMAHQADGVEKLDPIALQLLTASLQATRTAFNAIIAGEDQLGAIIQKAKEDQA